MFIGTDRTAVRTALVSSQILAADRPFLVKAVSYGGAVTSHREPVDVIIVGSGFGGSVTALRLADRGIRSVMLERGKRWPLTPQQDTFSSLQDPDGRSTWLSDFAFLGTPKPIDRFVGVLELTVGNGVVAFAGAGVGGGSLVYGAALVQPPKDLFERIFGSRVDYDEMDDVYFDRVRSVIQPTAVPRRILARPEYAASRSWRTLGEHAGLPTTLPELAVDWRIVGKELDGGRAPSLLNGDFWYGNNSGAKLSLDRNYLRRAENRGFVDIVTHQNVRAVRTGPNGRFLVTADEIDDHGSVTGQREYVARKLFLGAGSLGTSKLLVRSKARGWLPHLNDAVGTQWGNNGDFFSALDGLSQDVRPNRGGTVPVIIRDPDNAVIPTSVACFADWTKEGQHGVVASIGMAPVPAKGVFAYDAATDNVVLSWPKDDPEIVAAQEAGAATYARLADAGGPDCQRREPVSSQAYGARGFQMADGSQEAGTTPVDAAATAHPLGGVPLDAATDNVGMVRNYPGLYVVDAALVPGHTGCSNPALTIAALAERNIERIIDRDFT
jgi:cholesterol oxidase